MRECTRASAIPVKSAQAYGGRIMLGAYPIAGKIG